MDIVIGGQFRLDPPGALGRDCSQVLIGGHSYNS